MLRDGFLHQKKHFDLRRFIGLPRKKIPEERIAPSEQVFCENAAIVVADGKSRVEFRR